MTLPSYGGRSIEKQKLQYTRISYTILVACDDWTACSIMKHCTINIDMKITFRKVSTNSLQGSSKDVLRAAVTDWTY